MATLMQPPLKSWSASEHSRHLFMVLKGEDFKVNLLHILQYEVNAKSIML